MSVITKGWINIMNLLKEYNSAAFRIILYITAAAIFTATLFFMSMNGTGGTSAASQPMQLQSSSGSGYVLRLVDSSLVVCSADSRISLLEYEIEPQTLSRYDKALLESGISAADTDELKKLIEDFTS